MTTLCKSLGGNECKLLTITENVEFCLNYFELLKIKYKKEVRDRACIRQEIEKLCPNEKK